MVHGINIGEKKMKKEKNNEEIKEEIETLGLNAIKDFFKLSQEQMENLSPQIQKTIHNKAKVAMQFEKEMGVTKRAVEMNYLRVFRLIADDKKELKDFIKDSLPQYYTK